MTTRKYFSPPQRLLLVNKSEKENGGAVNGSAGNDGKREKRDRSLSLFSLPRVPRALYFFTFTQPPRVFSQAVSQGVTVEASAEEREKYTTQIALI